MRCHQSYVAQGGVVKLEKDGKVDLKGLDLSIIL